MQTVLRHPATPPEAGTTACTCKIDNPPYMELVIEATDESGPCALYQLCLSATTESRTAMPCATPEMCFRAWASPEAHT